MRFILAWIVLLFPAGLAAQGPRRPPLVTADPLLQVGLLPDSIFRRPNEFGMGLGGLLGGVAGLVAGAYAGSAIDRAGGCVGEEWCGLTGGLIGATAGTASMIPLGVHLSNGRRGNYGSAMAYSLLSAAAGWGAAYATQEAAPLILIPIAQLIVSIAVEKASTPASPI